MFSTNNISMNIGGSVAHVSTADTRVQYCRLQANPPNE